MTPCCSPEDGRKITFLANPFHQPSPHHLDSHRHHRFLGCFVGCNEGATLLQLQQFSGEAMQFRICQGNHFLFNCP